MRASRLWLRLTHTGFLLALLLTLAIPQSARAESSATLEFPKPEAWTGERLAFFIELRANGSFTGNASFDVPEIPNTLVMRVGNPVLGSLNEGDTEYFTQRHEFALFSQAEGTVEIPAISVRFSHKKGYTGPSFDKMLATKAATFTVRRPPESAGLGFLVTTPSLEIQESWQPTPGPLEVGSILKRTIVQQAENLTGIALAPAPSESLAGIRVYPGEPQVTDRTDRGRLSAERRETLTYLVQEPGLHQLPAIRYYWWNPQSETLKSITLPPVRFTAIAPPVPPPKPSPARFLWLLLPLALIGAFVGFRSRLARLASQLRDLIDPPSRQASRHFINACNRNDPAAAVHAWANVRSLRSAPITDPEVESLLRELYQHRYGRNPIKDWSGRPLAKAFRHASRRPTTTSPSQNLPSLNA